jgi:hypothetical protein
MTMSEETARYALPFLVPGQAQKELYHNEALVRIAAMLHVAVEGAPAATAPLAPLEGQCWIVGTGAGGAWAGRDGNLAAWTTGGWRFVEPQPGTLAWNKAAGCWVHFDGTQWGNGMIPVAGISVGGQQVVGQRQAPVPSPSGGTIIDAEARAAIGLITAALMSHGLIG